MEAEILDPIFETYGIRHPDNDSIAHRKTEVAVQHSFFQTITANFIFRTSFILTPSTARPSCCKRMLFDGQLTLAPLVDGSTCHPPKANPLQHHLQQEKGRQDPRWQAHLAPLEEARRMSSFPAANKANILILCSPRRPPPSVVTVASPSPVCPLSDPEPTPPSPSDRRPSLELTVVRGVLPVSRAGESRKFS